MMQVTLRAARTNTGMTLVQAAEKIGVSRDTLRHWERAESYPNVLQIKAIEAAYNVTYNDIIFLPRITL